MHLSALPTDKAACWGFCAKCALQALPTIDGIITGCLWGEADVMAHLSEVADLLPGPRAHVAVDQLRHLVHLIRVVARPILLVGQLHNAQCQITVKYGSAHLGLQQSKLVIFMIALSSLLSRALCKQH